MFLSPAYSFHRLVYQDSLHHRRSEAASDISFIQRESFWDSCLSWLRGLLPYSAGIGLAIALVCIAWASIFIVIAEASMSPWAISFNRLLIAGLVFGFWQRWTSQGAVDCQTSDPSEDQQTSGHWRMLGLFLLAGSSFAGSQGCATWSLTQTTVANSALLNNLMPLFTTLGAWLILGQRFSQRFVLGLGVAIAGVVAIGVQDLHLAADQLAGDAAALLAAVLLAIALLCIEQLRARYSTSATMGGISLIGAAVLLPVALLSPGSLFPHNNVSGLAIVALAVVSQVLGHGLLAYSLKSIASGLVSVSMLTIPVMSALLATILFGQHLGWINTAAFGVVLCGIYLAISDRAACRSCLDDRA